MSGCAGARNQVGAAAATAPPQAKRPTPAPVASRRPVAPKLDAPAKIGTDKPLNAAAATAAAPRFEAKATPFTCDDPVVCGGTVISFCYPVIVALENAYDCFSPLFAELKTGISIAVCAKSLTCGIIRCSTEVPSSFLNPCTGETIGCMATVEMDRVYLNGGLNVRLSAPTESDCGTAYKTYDFTIPLRDHLLCVGCAFDPFCPQFGLIYDCFITDINSIPITLPAGIDCPEPGQPGSATLYKVFGTIIFNSCESNAPIPI